MTVDSTFSSPNSLPDVRLDPRCPAWRKAEALHASGRSLVLGAIAHKKVASLLAALCVFSQLPRDFPGGVLSARAPDPTVCMALAICCAGAWVWGAAQRRHGEFVILRAIVFFAESARAAHRGPADRLRLLDDAEHLAAHPDVSPFAAGVGRYVAAREQGDRRPFFLDRAEWTLAIARRAPDLSTDFLAPVKLRAAGALEKIAQNRSNRCH